MGKMLAFVAVCLTILLGFSLSEPAEYQQKKEPRENQQKARPRHERQDTPRVVPAPGRLPERHVVPQSRPEMQRSPEVRHRPPAGLQVPEIRHQPSGHLRPPVHRPVVVHDFRHYRGRHVSVFQYEHVSVWQSGRWHRGGYAGRDGWWWIVNGFWYYYPRPMYPYPLIVSEVVFDDVAPTSVVPSPPPSSPFYPPPPQPPRTGFCQIFIAQDGTHEERCD